jgi:hypothetical protein
MLGSAITSMRAKAQTYENAVSVKALALREAYPPAKSDAPHRKMAGTE